MSSINNDISVIIPCYNKELFIEEALVSVLEQTYIEAIKEVIVVDDGSVDKTAEIVKKMEAANPVIKYVYQQNAGVSAARNTGILQARGKYIAFLDGDDIWEPGKIKAHYEYLTRFPEVGLFYTDFYKFFYRENKLIPIKVIAYQHDESNLLFKFVAKGAPVIPSTAIVKKECFEKAGLFDASLKHGGEDIDMWLRVANKYSFQHISQFLLKKRELAGSLGADTFENAKGYKIALDKMEQAVPAIAPYRLKRDALIQYKVGLYFYKKGENSKAITEAKLAIKKDFTLIKAYMLWLATVVKKAFGADVLRRFIR